MLVHMRCISKGRDAPQLSAESLWEVSLGCSAALLCSSSVLKNVVAACDVKMGHFQKKKKKKNHKHLFFLLLLLLKKS